MSFVAQNKATSDSIGMHVDNLCGSPIAGRKADTSQCFNKQVCLSLKNPNNSLSMQWFLKQGCSQNQRQRGRNE